VTYLDELNPAQKEAVLHKNGPLLIVAGAGAGKTKTLTYRILHLINKEVPAESILAVTFTNKAAREMLSRVGHLLGKTPPQYAGLSKHFPWIGTFHGLGVFLLREFWEEAGVSHSFSILDEDDALSFIRSALKTLGYDPKTVEPRKIRESISRAKGSGHDRVSYAQEGRGNTASIVARVWEIYDQKLRASHALDFDDLLLHSVHMLRKHPEVAKQLHQRWKYLHVDEYQDTNRLQYELVKLLTGPENNICVVGDSDQTIYTWRGAHIEHILHFDEDFLGTKVVKLEENYRSTQTILDAANAVITKNTKRQPKNLFTTKGKGEPISLYEALSEVDEAEYITEKIIEEGRRGTPYESMVVLYRTNFQSRAIEEALLGAKTPYSITGTRFFDRKEVKDVLAYVRAAINPNNPIDIARASSSPSRGIGEKTLELLLTGKKDSLKGKTRITVDRFLDLLREIKDRTETLPPSEVIAYIFRSSGILPALETQEDVERIGNLSELLAIATRYDHLSPLEGMERFLSDIALASDQDHGDHRKGVRLMTVHAAKGLEFDTVFIAGLEEDLFPQRRVHEAHDREKEEEERRLFYVALTRAKRKLFLSHASFRTIFGMRNVAVPSSYLADIDEHLLEVETSRIPKTQARKQKFVFFD